MEDHAHSLAQGDDLDLGIIKASAIEANVSLVSHAFDEVVQSIQISQQSGFSAAGWTDERSDLLLRDVHANIE